MTLQQFWEPVASCVVGQENVPANSASKYSIHAATETKQKKLVLRLKKKLFNKNIFSTFDYIFFYKNSSKVEFKSLTLQK